MTPRQPPVALRAAKRLSLAAIVVALLAVLVPSVSALECEGVPLDGGCLFTVTGGDTEDPDDGFAVTNAYDVPLWDFVQDKDRDALGYPISQRWVDGPFTLQAFQKVILQWDPGKQRVNYYNTLDVLANRYPHVELPFVPAHQVLAEDQGVSFGTIIRNHLALLEQNAAIKERFLAEPDWLNLYGLPIRYEERAVDGNPQGVQLLRTQRTVFVVWNVPTPGTTVGRVNLQNVPDKVKQLSNVIIPDRVKQPLRELAPDASAAIHALPWATDGVSTLEQAAIHRLAHLARRSPDLFWYLLHEMHLPWAREIIRKPWHSPLTPATLEGLDLVARIAALPWVQDGLTDFERLPFRILTDSAFIWPAYVAAVLQRAWLHDGVSHDERRVLDETFGYLYGSTLFPGNPQRLGQLWAQLVAMPFMDTIDGMEPTAFHSLTLGFRHGSDAQQSISALDGVVSYLTARGGLTDDHLLILELHGTDRHFIDSITEIHDPTLIDQYLVDPSLRGITIERRRISLPLAGATELIVLREVPASAQTMDVLEESVRMVENLMGVRYPTNTIVAIIGRFGTSSAIPSIALKGGVFPTAGEDISVGWRSIVLHELAHHYWSQPTTWISEGAPTFLQIRSGYSSASMLDSLRRSCPRNRLESVPEHGPEHLCNYALGGSLFLDLYHTLGDDAFHRGFRRLYQSINAIASRYYDIIHGEIWINSPETGDYCDYCEGVHPSLYHVRRAFVDEGEPATAAAANHVISHWYFGPQE